MTTPSTGEIYPLPDDEFPPFDPTLIFSAFHLPTNNSESSSSSDSKDPELGVCEYICPPPFEFCIFSFPSSKSSPEARIDEINAEMGEISPYQYYERKALREEKNKLLREIKGKNFSSPLLDPHAHHIIYTPRYYTPIKIHKSHPKIHKDC